MPPITIIGAGVMGLACAWRLAQTGARVELYDMRGPGQGATLAALGALWPASPLVNGPLQQLHRASLWQYEEFLAELAHVTALPVNFRRLGRLELLNSSKILARAQEEARAACANWPAFAGTDPVMEYLSPAAIAARWPQLAPASFGGLLCRATAQVQVADLVASLRAACGAAGVTVHDTTPVVSLDRREDHIAGIRTAAGATPCDAVLVTAGAWSPLLDPAVAQIAPVRPVKGQGLALQKPAGVRLDMIVKSEKIYMIPWDGELLVGSTTEPDAGFDEKTTADGRHFLRQGASHILPGLKDAVVLRHWAGLRPQNPARRHPPIMGRHPTLQNLFVCTGHFKTGIGLAPLVSRLMARVILQNELPPELAPFTPQ
jgi:glycine oxidase